MTLDEDAAKVLDECEVPAKPSENIIELDEKWRKELKVRIAAFGRRCAEAMREELERVVDNRVMLLKSELAAMPSQCEYWSGAINEARECAQAVRRVKIA